MRKTDSGAFGLFAGTVACCERRERPPSCTTSSDQMSLVLTQRPFRNLGFANTKNESDASRPLIVEALQISCESLLDGRGRWKTADKAGQEE